MSVFHEEGLYRVRVQTATVIQSKNANKQTGKPTDQVQLDLEILGYYEGDDIVDPGKKSRFPPNVYLAVTDATMGTPGNPGWVAQTLAYLGFTGDFDRISEIEGWEGDAFCQYEERYDGQGQRERWSISRPRSSSPAPEKKVVRSLNTKFGKLFKDTKQAPRPEPRPEPAPVNPGEQNGVATATKEDDIPF